MILRRVVGASLTRRRSRVTLVAVLAFCAASMSETAWADSTGEYEWSGTGLGTVAVQQYENVVRTEVAPSRIEPGEPFTYSVYTKRQADCVANCTPCPPTQGCPPTVINDFTITGSTTTGLYRVEANEDLVDVFLSPPWPNGFFQYIGMKSARGRNTNAYARVVQEIWNDVSVSGLRTAGLAAGCYQIGPQPGDLDTTFWFYRMQVRNPTRGEGTFATLQVGDTVECDQTTTIVIEKQIEPLAGNEALRFRFSGAAEGVIGDGETIVADVEPGVHSVTEEAYEGWNASIACDDPTGNSSGTERTATIDVAAGETVKCTFTNTASELPCDGLTFDEVKGDDAPQERDLETFPNSDVACEGIWIPGVEVGEGNGFIPQGFALDGRTVLVSGYFRDEELVRVYELDLDTGKLLDERDFPGLKHGGGILVDETGAVWLADTARLLRMDRTTMFSADPPDPQEFKLAKPLRGSFLANGRAGHLWIGVYDKSQPSRMYEYEIAELVAALAPIGGKEKKKPTLGVDDAVGSVDIERKAQGADVSGSGVWVSSSSSTCGILTRNGSDTFGFGPGVEEIETDGQGGMWAIFEAGAEKYQERFYPILARFQLDALSEVPDCMPW